MKINENPFKILNIPNNASSLEIHNICQTSILLMNDEIYNTYENILNNTNKRLEAEINWFPQISKEKLDNIISNQPMDLDENIFAKISICRLKLCGNMSIEELGEITKKLNLLCIDLKKIDTQQVMEMINTDRKCANFTLVKDIEKIDEKIEELIDDVVDEINERLYNYEEKEILEFFNKILAQNNNRMEDNINIGIVMIGLIENYKKHFDRTIDKIQSDILIYIDKVFNNTADGIFIEEQQMIPQLYATMQIWYKYAYPLLILQETFTNEKNKYVDVQTVFSSIRGLISKLIKEGDYDTAIILQNKLYYIFNQIPSYRQIIKNDCDFIRKLKDEEQEIAKVNREDKAYEITMLYKSPIKIPIACTCCLKDAKGSFQSVLATSVESTYRGKINHTLKIDFPLCNECKKHKNEYKVKSIIITLISIIVEIIITTIYIEKMGINRGIVILGTIIGGTTGILTLQVGLWLSKLKFLPSNHSTREDSVILKQYEHRSSKIKIFFTNKAYATAFEKANSEKILDKKVVENKNTAGSANMAQAYKYFKRTYVIILLIAILIFFSYMERCNNSNDINTSTKTYTYDNTKKKNLENQLVVLKNEIQELEQELIKIEDRMKNLKNQYGFSNNSAKIELYNSYVYSYNSKYNEYAQKINEYNTKVDQYNSM